MFGIKKVIVYFGHYSPPVLGSLLAQLAEMKISQNRASTSQTPKIKTGIRGKKHRVGHYTESS
jgi:hypothetical protein